MPRPVLALQPLQDLHDQLSDRSVLLPDDREELLLLAEKALSELARLASLDMDVPWQRQVRASCELVALAVAEANRPVAQWSSVLAALKAALYPWAHLPSLPVSKSVRP